MFARYRLGLIYIQLDTDFEIKHFKHEGNWTKLYKNSKKV